jgi:BirA family biotin operon repressor/biotin-[acetyl-CoA-carboxylase] ligase
MSLSIQTYQEVLFMLFRKPIAIDVVQKKGVDIRRFISDLRSESATIVEEDGFLHWKDGDGFGIHSLSGRLARPVHFVESCSSTNDWARDIIKEKDIQEGVFVCVDQWSGRGRLGREWRSDRKKSLVCSFVCTPSVSMDRVACCSLVWMAEIAHRLGLFVKWPNDLMSASGKKIGGCLTELIDDQPRCIFGLGINVGHDKAPFEHASSLFLEQNSLHREEVLSVVHDVVFDHELDFSLTRWRERALYMGQQIRVRDIEGTMTGIRSDGALLIDDQPVLTGDVELVEDRR